MSQTEKQQFFSSAKKFPTFFTRANIEDTILCSRWFPSAHEKIAQDRKTCFDLRIEDYLEAVLISIYVRRKNVQCGKTFFRSHP